MNIRLVFYGTKRGDRSAKHLSLMGCTENKRHVKAKVNLGAIHSTIVVAREKKWNKKAYMSAYARLRLYSHAVRLSLMNSSSCARRYMQTTYTQVKTYLRVHMRGVRTQRCNALYRYVIDKFSEKKRYVIGMPLNWLMVYMYNKCLYEAATAGSSKRQSSWTDWISICGFYLK